MKQSGVQVGRNRAIVDGNFAIGDRYGIEDRVFLRKKFGVVFLRKGGSLHRVSFAALRVGQQVEVWTRDGFIAETLPGKAEAVRVVIVGGTASP